MPLLFMHDACRAAPCPRVPPNLGGQSVKNTGENFGDWIKVGDPTQRCVILRAGTRVEFPEKFLNCTK